MKMLEVLHQRLYLVFLNDAGSRGAYAVLWTFCNSNLQAVFFFGLYISKHLY